MHFLLNWKHYPLPLDNPEKIDFSKGWTEGQPAFYAYDFTVQEPKDTYLDLSEFGKGVAFVNGQNLGRFWNVGPTLSLYIPHSYLKEGDNRIIIFIIANLVIHEHWNSRWMYHRHLFHRWRF